jgi:hypothetical protein
MEMEQSAAGNRYQLCIDLGANTFDEISSAIKKVLENSKSNNNPKIFKEIEVLPGKANNAICIGVVDQKAIFEKYEVYNAELALSSMNYTLAIALQVVIINIEPILQ